MSKDFVELGNKLQRVAHGFEDPRVLKAAGIAGKKAALDEAAKAVGGDRAFSGWRKGRPVRLGAGFDITGRGEVTTKLRPYGVWVVAEKGRKPSDARVLPKRARRRAARGRGGNAQPALSTPWGPRASVSRGKGTHGRDAIRKAFKGVRVESTKAAEREVKRVLREVF